jgi:hypothetical protein
LKRKENQMKATFTIADGEFEVDITTNKTSYKAKGTILLDEDAQDVRAAIENLTRIIIAKSSNYTQSKSTLNK